MMNPKLTTLAACLAAILSSAISCHAQVEVGKVKWSRDLDQALANSKTSGKPVFLLFQEVPG